MRFFQFRAGLTALVAGVLLALPAAGRAEAPKPADKEQSFRVPYQLTETKHILVRVKINGKGPFNLILDTGAPALYFGTHAAKKLGLEPNDKGWGTFDRFEIEGGLVMEKVKARIEDPFQLTGMNKMNLAGVRLDGMMGYTVLAHYRIQYDFTQPHLVWTKLDWTPPPPRGLGELGGGVPPEMAAMGGLVNFASALMGKRGDPIFIARGFLGVELAEKNGQVSVSKVLPATPAAEAGVRSGDQLVLFQEKEIKTLAELHKLSKDHPADKDMKLQLLRDGKKVDVTVKPGAAF